MKKILLMCLVALIGIGTADAQKPKKGEKKNVTVEFLTSIDCEGCAKKVNETIPYEKGVREVSVDVPSKIVTVTYDPAKTNNENIIKAFEKIKLEASVAGEGCKDACCGEKKECKGECKDACCGEKKECKDACCDDKKECNGEYKDACCEGHDHKHDHGHNHKH